MSQQTSNQSANHNTGNSHLLRGKKSTDEPIRLRERVQRQPAQEELEAQMRMLKKDMNGMKLELENATNGELQKKYDKLVGEHAQLNKEFEEVHEEVLRLRK